MIEKKDLDYEQQNCRSLSKKVEKFTPIQIYVEITYLKNHCNLNMPETRKKKKYLSTCITNFTYCCIKNHFYEFHAPLHTPCLFQLDPLTPSPQTLSHEPLAPRGASMYFCPGTSELPESSADPSFSCFLGFFLIPSNRNTNLASSPYNKPERSMI